MINLLERPDDKKYAFNRAYYGWISYLNGMEFGSLLHDKNGIPYISALITVEPKKPKENDKPLICGKMNFCCRIVNVPQDFLRQLKVYWPPDKPRQSIPAFIEARVDSAPSKVNKEAFPLWNIGKITLLSNYNNKRTVILELPEYTEIMGGQVQLL